MAAEGVRSGAANDLAAANSGQMVLGLRSDAVQQARKTALLQRLNDLPAQDSAERPPYRRNSSASAHRSPRRNESGACWFWPADDPRTRRVYVDGWATEETRAIAGAAAVRGFSNGN